MINALFKLITTLMDCYPLNKRKESCLTQVKNSITEDFFLIKQKYYDRSLLAIGFGLFFFLHFALFVNFYISYIKDDTKYHDAKAYYAVGMVPHTYSVVLGRITTPLHPALLGLNIPATKIKEYLFNQGVKLIPESDGERELWEYEWFYYPYTIRSSFIYDTYYKRDISPQLDNTEFTYLFFQKKLSRLYEIITQVNTKKIADKHREADMLKKLPLMISYYDLHSSWFMPYKYLRDSKYSAHEFLVTTPKYINQKKQMRKWLESMEQRVDNSPIFKAWGDSHYKSLLKILALRDQALLYLMEREMFAQIRSYEFSCKNPIVTTYKELRDRYIIGSGNSVLDRLMEEGREKEAFILNDESKDNIMSEFFRQALEHYCKVSVRGVSKHYEPTNRGWHNNLLDEDRVYHKEVKALNKIFKGAVDE
jgi:hypothetical protein